MGCNAKYAARLRTTGLIDEVSELRGATLMCDCVGTEPCVADALVGEVYAQGPQGESMRQKVAQAAARGPNTAPRGVRRGKVVLVAMAALRGAGPVGRPQA